MNQKFKIITILLFALCFSGCASTSTNDVLEDFVDGAVYSREYREKQNNEYEDSFQSDDVVVGFLNILLQSVVDLFDSDEPE